MQTLRKKGSPCKYKNEPSRFLGDGVSFKAKLIGILEVNEARGDRMCQEALAELKMAIRAAGEHKQRITVNIAIDGLRLRDEKTGDSLYHHPVHKISFIAQDMTDARAFGYIFGSPDTGHRFFGIKTDKAASQVVIAMRDLFQVVFELKKREIEVAKQHIEQKTRIGTSDSSSSSQSTSKPSGEPKGHARSASGAEAIADLVDLELELNSIQQGISQMERITPSEPFAPSSSDPFGDSFTSFTPKPFLPPPPPGRERASRLASSDGGSRGDSSLFSSSRDEPSSEGWFTPTDAFFDESLQPASLEVDKPSQQQQQQQQPQLQQQQPQPATATTSTTTATTTSSSVPESEQQPPLAGQSQYDVFVDLDPLGTGRNKPYVDKKLFFQELKNPPKKVLKDLVGEALPTDPNTFNVKFEEEKASKGFPPDPFADSDPFDQTDPFAETDIGKVADLFGSDFQVFTTKPESSEVVRKPSEKIAPPPSGSKSPKKTSHHQHKQHQQHLFDRQLSVGLEAAPKAELVKQTTFDAKFEEEPEAAPEPPPRPTANLALIKPPPLPPKKQMDQWAKPPPRPPHTEAPPATTPEPTRPLYQIVEAEKSPPLPLPARKTTTNAVHQTKALPKDQFSDEDYLTPISPPVLPPQQKKQASSNSLFLLPPPSKKDSTRGQKNNQPVQVQKTVASIIESESTSVFSSPPDKNRVSPDTLDMTLSQLTLSGLNELASKLGLAASQLSNMTLVQLTSFLSNHMKSNGVHEDSAVATTTPATSTAPSFKADFDANFSEMSKSDSFDRYAVFKELIEQRESEDRPEEKADEDLQNESDPAAEAAPNPSADRYAALREIVEEDLREKEKTGDDFDEQSESLEEAAEEEPPVLPHAPEPELLKSPDGDTAEASSPKADEETEPLPKSPDSVAKSTDNGGAQGSGSDPATNSSPEVFNGDNPAESWAIFEEGASPWSSDSKEYGAASPAPQWEDDGCWDRTRRRSGRHRHHDEEDIEPPPRSHPNRPMWGRGGGGGGGGGVDAGHSSSSREVSPWEEIEEPRHQRWTSGDSRRDSWDEDRYYRAECCDRQRKAQEEAWLRRRGRYCCPDQRPGWCCSSHDSLWEDDYPEDLGHYATTRRNWKRPSSATVPGSSDGERDRRHRPGRRSKSRDSHFSDAPAYQRHKPDPRSSHRVRRKPHFEPDYPPQSYRPSSRYEMVGEKQYSSKKKKESYSPDSDFAPAGRRGPRSPFENDFVGPIQESTRSRFPFKAEADEEAEPDYKPRRSSRQQQQPQQQQHQPPSKAKSSFDETRNGTRQKSLFEDDFQPQDQPPEKPKAKAAKPTEHQVLRKSESVNIFARENDPFDDDFFNDHDEAVGGAEKQHQQHQPQQHHHHHQAKRAENSRPRWTEDFDSFSAFDEK